MYVCFWPYKQTWKTNFNLFILLFLLLFIIHVFLFSLLVYDYIVYTKCSMKCFGWQALIGFNITLQFSIATLDKPLHIIVVVGINSRQMLEKIDMFLSGARQMVKWSFFGWNQPNYLKIAYYIYGKIGEFLSLSPVTKNSCVLVYKLDAI